MRVVCGDGGKRGGGGRRRPAVYVSCQTSFTLSTEGQVIASCKVNMLEIHCLHAHLSASSTLCPTELNFCQLAPDPAPVRICVCTTKFGPCMVSAATFMPGKKSLWKWSEVWQSFEIQGWQASHSHLLVHDQVCGAIIFSLVAYALMPILVLFTCAVTAALGHKRASWTSLRSPWLLTRDLPEWHLSTPWLPALPHPRTPKRS